MKVISWKDWPIFNEIIVLLKTKHDSICTGDNHVTCGQLSKPDVATLSYRRSHYWWEKER